MNQAHAFSSPNPMLPASAPSLLARIGKMLWRLLEQAGERRGRQELSSLARQHELSRPEFAAGLREAAQRGGLL